MSIKVYNIGDGTYLVRCGTEFAIVGDAVPSDPPDTGGGPGGLGGDGGADAGKLRDPLSDGRSTGSEGNDWKSITRPSGGTDTAAVHLPGRGASAPGYAVRVCSTDEIVAHLNRHQSAGELWRKNPSFILDRSMEVDVGDIRKAALKARLNSISIFMDGREQDN